MNKADLGARSSLRAKVTAADERIAGWAVLADLTGRALTDNASWPRTHVRPPTHTSGAGCRSSNRYGRFRAITMRWTWFVPS
ncbi:hypothetical protein ACIRP2_24590 [Streptomyces sp. NPDC101194]|uniref:hypothetical protein n=1 Tax=Streptomyces sp. NPDC101194 TaxID=3366127 RepID=UPI003807AA3E